MLVFGLCAGSNVYAQETLPAECVTEDLHLVTPPSSNIWRKNFGEQAAKSLRSSSASDRLIMLSHVVKFTARQTQEVDLTAEAPALLDIYARSQREEHRIMAVTALYGIAKHNDRVAPMMETLVELLADEQSTRVRKHMLSVQDLVVAGGQKRTLFFCGGVSEAQIFMSEMGLLPASVVQQPRYRAHRAPIL